MINVKTAIYSLLFIFSCQISFRKRDEGQYDGRTAIDGIEMMNCGTPAPSQSCSSPSNLLCSRTNVCVVEHIDRCDGVDACGDETDEYNCGKRLSTTSSLRCGEFQFEKSCKQFNIYNGDEKWASTFILQLS